MNGTLSPIDTQKFVEGLELPELRNQGAMTEEEPLPPPDFASTKADTVAVGSQIAAFAQGFNPALREPIANAFLIAQLAADRLVQNGSGNTEIWYTEYVRVLGGLGLIDEDRSITFKEVSGTAVEVHQALIPVLTAVMAPAVVGATALVTVLEGLARMDANKPWITLFDRTSQRFHCNQFQISYAAMDGLVPVVTLAAFELKGSQSVLQVLFFRFRESQAQLNHFSKRMTMNTAAFAAAAPAVQARLANRQAAFVAAIDI